jgi:hypothetical protein
LIALSGDPRAIESRGSIVVPLASDITEQNSNAAD